MVGRRQMQVIFLIQALCVLHCVSSTEAFVGVTYGTRGNNLPVTADVVRLLKGLGIGYVKLLDANPKVIQAFGGSNIQLWVSVQNQEILGIGQSNTTAQAWVMNNVVQYLGASNISGIIVGDQVLTTQDPAILPYLLPAMINLHAALVSAKVDGSIKISTPHSVGVLVATYPPYEARFNSSLLTPFVLPMLDFLSQTESYLMLNVYPISYFQGSSVISLDYALFRPNQGTIDPNTGLHYYNLFDALCDAFYYALQAANHSSIPIVVAATGWPSAGDFSENGVSLENAQTYNQNLITRTVNQVGTPLRPGAPINVMIYELFNENSLPGPTSARNWGLYYSNQTAVYQLDWTGTGLVPNSNAKSWCVAKDNVSPQALQLGLDYACGSGADCVPIQPGGKCFLPNTVASHASWAFNSYYQKYSNAPGTCDFTGTATITYVDPSYPGCVFPASNPAPLRASSSAISVGLLLTVAMCVLSSLVQF